MKKVRTTMKPDEEVEVNEAEYTDLKRWGLLVGSPSPQVPEVKKRATGVAEQKEG